MILTKSRLKIFYLFILMFAGGRASALDAFGCLRDLLPLTERVNVQLKRKSGDAPFFLSARYLVFPELALGVLRGFYIYTETQAWHYDSIVETGLPLSQLGPGLYELVAQPNGLETVTIWVSAGRPLRPELAGGEAGKSHDILKLSTRAEMSGESLWQPLNAELKLRKNWVQTHNMDEISFKSFSKAMDSSCRE